MRGMVALRGGRSEHENEAPDFCKAAVTESTLYQPSHRISGCKWNNGSNLSLQHGLRNYGGFGYIVVVLPIIVRLPIAVGLRIVVGFPLVVGSAPKIHYKAIEELEYPF